MEDKILQAIENTYHLKYTGMIKITKLNPGYNILLGLNDNNEILISTSAEIDNQEDFIKYFILDLRERKLHDSKYFTEIRCLDDPGLYYRTKPKILK